MEYILNLVWNVNGGAIDSSLIFMNILRSNYNNNGDTILDVLIQLKLFSVLNYLIKQNQDCDISFLAKIEINRINEVRGIRQRYVARPKD